jgi:hypothetical protein
MPRQTLSDEDYRFIAYSTASGDMVAHAADALTAVSLGGSCTADQALIKVVDCDIIGRALWEQNSSFESVMLHSPIVFSDGKWAS